MSQLPPLPLIDGCLFVDNSHWIEPIMTCNRLHEYESLLQRISSAERSALNFGSAQHLVREYRYKCYKTGRLDQTYHDTVALLLDEYFKQHIVPEGDFRTLNWAIEVSNKYDEKYSIEPHTLLQYDVPQPCEHCKDHGKSEGWEICPWCLGNGKCDVMVELSFAMPLYIHYGKEWIKEGDADVNKECIPVIYTGRIDLPYMQDGDLWIRDTKTTSMLGDMFWNKMRMLSQARGYVWAFEQLTGKKVKGYQIDAIRTKEPPLYVVNGTESKRGKAQSPDTWWNESLARERFYLKDGEIDAWKQNTIELIEEFFWHYSRGYMPQKTAWCSQYGKCQYYDVCNLDVRDRGLMLSSGLFMDNKWTPLKPVKQETK